ncbi:putative acetyltransferase [Anatilimnocola aggregata]|uniref:Putative acetyltransferase n=1 Tax=Anatilimnocola aggregata TaxID=2528021 RepID=A0A517YES4_9BACT|nr:GNAT family N-acetyltransferase [Anatilimnocola aggregata]QDU28740.1 putative acetyltransferase [Anatilimnocola aggregata]
MQVRLANLHDATDARAVVELLDMYSQDEFGSSAPLSPAARENLIPGLIKHGGARVFLASDDTIAQQPIGLAICLLGFSSFRGAPLLNIHDIAVSPAARGHGVGTALLLALEEDAKSLGCCKVTMEVRSDNHRAQAVYQRAGYHGSQPETWFWSKSLG